MSTVLITYPTPPHDPPTSATSAAAGTEEVVAATIADDLSHAAHADWRAVDAWSRTIGNDLAHCRDVRAELTRVRAELEHCLPLLHASSGPAASGADAAPGVTHHEHPARGSPVPSDRSTSEVRHDHS